MLIRYIDCKNGVVLRNSDNEIIEHEFKLLPFRILKIVLEPNSSYTKYIMQLAKARLKELNFNKANSSGEIRDDKEIQYKSFAGLIIERLCFSLLNHYNANDNVKIELDNSNSPINQIDLRIIKNFTNSSNEFQSITKSVEIRSSFPFKPIEKAIANDFDILGFYKNNVKSSEIQKDFYIRFLFSLENISEFHIFNQYNNIDYAKTATNLLQNLYFDEELNLKRNLTIYFIGGATKEMMNDDSIAYYGNMTSVNFNQNKNGIFKKIKIRNALDSIAIMQLMLNCITDEAIKAK
ncbi:hypothetical protein OFO01_07725 [Campylobacter sp. JMF_01 NE2]|uniref:hypothetical protein n=1 Tax=unclassified Campylobacter TaxID=2593542 RepID=UPI0022E9CFC6|nr:MULTISPECIES: hypothetical protein [unclassified Campylobacter]MDA3053308.1 hypothetical protein [Campylobacter sp. JMF_03 NE3]MDA3067672.1 hypothetical protein [Campylobacter sp. JMF_01 NE2]